MLKKNSYIVFWLDKQKFALNLSIVERVVRIAEVAPIPKTPDFILGAINYQGEFIPVVNTRNLFNLKEKDASLSDQLIIALVSNIKIALWVDSVSDIIEQDNKNIIKSDQVLMNSEYVEGALKLNDEMVIIYDLNTFFELNKEALIKPKHKKGSSDYKVANLLLKLG